MGEKFVDFRAIKQRVSMQSALGKYGVKLRKVNQHSLRGMCPLPAHTSEKSSESFSVHTGKNIWACQSTSCSVARQGKKGGNVLDFVAAMEDCSVKDAALKLQEWFGESNPNTRRSSRRKTSSAPEKTQPVAEAVQQKDRTEVNKPLSFELQNIDHGHAYLRQRGIKEEVAKDFDVGYFSGRGSMSGRIVIPIHNQNGELVAYAGRAIDDNEPKYKLPGGFRKSLELFNLNRIGESERVIVVEGFFDCMKVTQAGYPCVALMGSTLTTGQEEMLSRKFKRIVLLLDGDDAGRKATNESLIRLWPLVPTVAIILADGNQPDRMSSDAIQHLLNLL